MMRPPRRRPIVGAPAAVFLSIRSCAGTGPEARRRRNAWKLAGVILLAASADGLTTSGAQAQKLEARYAISMTGIRVGQSAWTVRIEADRYSASATGGSVDLMNVLVRGEGSARVSGSIKDGRLVPAEFSSKLVEEGEKSDLKMTFEEGVVTAVEADGPPPGPDRVPLTQAHVMGVTDPLTALLIAEEDNGGTAPNKESCNRTLSIFDGRRRYDLVLSFKRIEDIRDKQLPGRVLVCNVILHPIAGHRASSMITKYVADRRDIEISFAQIAGTAVLAPFRLMVPTLIGTMAVQAASFETSPLP
jgi:Protein of unknown function (DUF3108)